MGLIRGGVGRCAHRLIGGGSRTKNGIEKTPAKHGLAAGGVATPWKKSAGWSFSINLGTADETVFVSEGGTSSSTALVGESLVVEVSTILGRSGALRRFEVSVATRIGAGLGSVREIGADGVFFFEVLAHPVKAKSKAIKKQDDEK